MKTFQLFILLLISSQLAFAQAEESEKRKPSDDIQTLSRSTGHLGAYGALVFKGTDFNGKNVGMAGIKAGCIINRALAVGFEGYGIIPSAKYANIVPNRMANIVGGYGGLFIEPIFFSNKVIHFTLPISGGSGWLGYLEDFESEYYVNDELISDDIFWYFEPGIAAEVNVSKAFRIGVGYSRRFTESLELQNTSSGAFSKNNLSVTLKFGRF